MATISPFRAALPIASPIAAPNEFFGAAKRKFNQYLESGFYTRESAEALYIYRIKRPHRSHTGLIACANVLDFINGKIKKHENTLSAKEDKMLGLFYERQAMIKPILVTYPNAIQIDALLNRLTVALPVSFELPFEDEVHAFWQISDPKNLAELVRLFDQCVPETYICDGHHRAASSERLYHHAKQQNPHHTGTEPYNFMLLAYFAASEIEVHNYNRIIGNVGMNAEQFLKKLDETCYAFPVPKRFSPAAPHQFGMYLDRQWYKVELKPHAIPNPAEIHVKDRLDVQLLNQYVLEGILKIEDIRTDTNVTYIEGPLGASGLELAVNGHKDKNGAGFVLYPVALEDLMQIADESGTMPPKSTWIEPRMRNGFVVKLYE